ncbi:site-2 protease family protein [Nocardioides sp. SLBN-35]|uniref:site-2 protease family protein n=1 Tax=Nocardioides sp. SLBN-35 TaxID=2768445 RepID=UPI00114FFA2B|nr:site-2 protease family protein [Nocardioides sp. SLBN-35]
MEISWSTLVVVGILTWALADGVLPVAAPGYARLSYYLAGLVGALTLIGSLLAHELAHAVAARRSGVQVERLTLWLFGGVATLRGDPRNPRAELRIAAVGPVTSLAIAVAMAAVWAALGQAGADELVVSVAGWLALTNGMLAVFNLLPGAPLDGGRILRAVLWWRRGDRVSAASTAAAAGQVLGWCLIATATMAVLLGDVVDGLWLTMIGWFVLTAARTEQVATQAERALGGIVVRDVMSTGVRTGSADTTVDEFISRYVVSGHHSCYPVVEAGGAVVGLMTLGCLRAVPAAARSTTSARDACLRMEEIARCGPDEPLVQVLSRVTRQSGLRALVFQDGLLVGIVTPSDVARTLESRALAATR